MRKIGDGDVLCHGFSDFCEENDRHRRDRIASDDLIVWAGGSTFATILADPPWRFQNSTGKVAPEHKRLRRYATLSLNEIMALPVSDIVQEPAHLYLWVPNALLPDGLAVMRAWGFTYKTNIVWRKIRKDGGSDGRGCGFYFRNVTELVLVGVRGKHARTLDAGRRQVNYLESKKREHSRKPDELYPIIEACSSGPFADLFACRPRLGWRCWGDEFGDEAPAARFRRIISQPMKRLLLPSCGAHCDQSTPPATGLRPTNGAHPIVKSDAAINRERTAVGSLSAPEKRDAEEEKLQAQATVMRRNLDLEHCTNKRDAVIAAYVQEFEDNDKKIAEGAWATSLDLSRITFWHPILMRYCPNHPLTQSLRRERENLKKRKEFADFFFWEWD